MLSLGRDATLCEMPLCILKSLKTLLPLPALRPHHNTRTEGGPEGADPQTRRHADTRPGHQGPAREAIASQVDLASRVWHSALAHSTCPPPFPLQARKAAKAQSFARVDKALASATPSPPLFRSSRFRIVELRFRFFSLSSQHIGPRLVRLVFSSRLPASARLYR
ncbi:translin-associated protein X [Moesziomyces antarcticus T-34]|uniref:Translin-associated protein X n=1 Tax=Pseudozyma antarctica (strain T-34) TaxID=1151754 RepID=M9LLX5_PSEA3|nr:translin-associated protein X [Moesziomyces antarcticus T-34]